ncbi:tRNA (adenosine(37)-N6)-threonylcarbamoyltransferase complex transferase subunit TsaD [Candidatus Saccharibacteria bacterium]|nr:tRNA (adenosine(37)-N6)-threonylcarbamoyltransferase complex transferase subunit TsaD [Candidatus Saccharibacteria bacterium]
MIILGIESSCDETAAAILKDGKLLSNVVVSQIDIFKAYGGVIPEIAARSHLEAILPVIDQALEDAQVTWDNIDAIAVTHTPGLLGSLLIGTLTARTLAILHNKPLYAVHHLKSHIYSNWLLGQTPEFPLLALVISGGHTQIIRMTAHNQFDIIGTTLDDAVGECFDKIAKILGLPYPGGPSIANAAKTGNPNKYHFPHPRTENPLDFSFSGLKTAVLRTVQKECSVPINYPSHDLKNLLTPKQISDFAASFQKTAIDILLEKLSLALEQHPDTKSIVFAGGVSANKELRGAASRRGERCSSSGSFPPARAATYIPDGTEKVATKEQAFPDSQSMTSRTESGDPDKSARPQALEAKPKIFFPSPEFSGDNAAMVAMACFWEIKSGIQPTDPRKLTLAPRSILC